MTEKDMMTEAEKELAALRHSMMTDNIKMTRMLALPFYIEAGNGVSRKGLVEIFKKKFDTSDNYEGMITRYLKAVQQCFQIHITWNARSGYIIRDWGVFNKKRFLTFMAEVLDEKVPASGPKPKKYLEEPDITRRTKKRISTVIDEE